MRFPASRVVLFVCLAGLLAGFLSAGASAQSSTEPYPALTADQMRDLVIRSHDIGLMMRLLQFREHPEMLQTMTAIGASTNLKFFIQLNNCNNPQINRLLDNEFEYPKIAAYYKEKAPEILAEVPTTIAYWLPISLGEYDDSSGGFVVNGQPRYFPVTERGFPGGCAVFNTTPADSGDYFVRVPFILQRLPMSESDARRYLDGLPNPAQREVALKFEIQVTPNSAVCQSAAAVRGQILNQPMEPWEIANPNVWAEAREQLQNARGQCTYVGALAGNIEAATKAGGETLASFDPNPARGSDGLVFRKTREEQERLSTFGTGEEFAFALPVFLERAVAGSRIQLGDYAQEQEFIVNAVELCSGMTQRMRQRGWDSDEFHPDAIGSQYSVCQGQTNVTKAVRAYDPTKERALWLAMSLGLGNNHATVSLGQLQGEYAGTQAGRYRFTVLDYRVLPPGAAVGPETPVTAENGEWLDTDHDLIWALRDSPMFYQISGARDYCSQLRTGGSGYWRLPAIEELQTIQDPASANGLRGGITLQQPDDSVWSGTLGSYKDTPDNSSGVAMTLTFSPGRRPSAALRAFEANYTHALCVRDYRWWLQGHTVAEAPPSSPQTAAAGGEAAAGEAAGPGCAENMLGGVETVGGRPVFFRLQFVNEAGIERKLYRIDEFGKLHGSGSVKPHAKRPVAGYGGEVWLVQDQNQACVIKFRTVTDAVVTLGQ